MKFSLIVPTINRTEQLARLMDSLDRQDYRDFEVIVVDQNVDSRLDGILAPFRDRYRILHVRISTRGAARARNQGLREITGDIVAFPDDDCWYPDGLLGTVARHFRDNPDCDGLCGKTVDETGADSANRWNSEPVVLNRRNIWNSSIAAATFFRRAVVDRVGEFDESLGVGSGTKWGSGEETDYIVRALDLRFRFEYDPALLVHHPQVASGYDEQSMQRALSYARGFGYVLRKQRFSIWSILYFLIRPLGGAVLSLATGRFRKMKYHLLVLGGRLSGLAM